MARQFASRVSLIAFAATAIHGAMAGRGFSAAMKTALMTGAAFFLLGLIFGELARRLVEESVRTELEQSLAEPPSPK